MLTTKIGSSRTASTSSSEPGTGLGRETRPAPGPEAPEAAAESSRARADSRDANVRGPLGSGKGLAVRIWFFRGSARHLERQASSHAVPPEDSPMGACAHTAREPDSREVILPL